MCRTALHPGGDDYGLRTTWRSADSGISLQRGALREGIVEVGMLTGVIEPVRFGNGAPGRSQGVESARTPFRMGSVVSRESLR